MFYERDPSTMEKLGRPVGLRDPTTDIIRMGIFDAVRFCRKRPITALSTVAGADLLVALLANWSLLNPGSGLHQAAVNVGLFFDQQAPGVAQLGLMAESLLASLPFHNIQPTVEPSIVRGIMEALITSITVSIGGGGLFSVVDRVMGGYERRLDSGGVRVSRLLPVQRIFVGDPRTVEGIQEARKERGLPTYGSICINPNGSEHMDGLPNYCNYIFHSPLAAVPRRYTNTGERDPDRIREDVMGLCRAKEILFTDRTPDHCLFAGKEHRAFQLRDAQTMLDGIRNVVGGNVWRDKKLLLDTTSTSFQFPNAKNTAEGALGALAKKIGMRVSLSQVEELLVDEALRVARDRKRNESESIGDLSVSIGIALGDGVNTHEAQRMADAFFDDTDGKGTRATLLHGGIQQEDKTDHDLLVVYANTDREVVERVQSAIGLDSDLRRVIFPVVGRPGGAHELSDGFQLPAFVVTHAIVDKMSSQSDPQVVYSK